MLWRGVKLSALCLLLGVQAGLAQVSAQDCAALEVALAGTGASHLDLVARDDLARRIERHGPALGLSVSTARLQALALREDDPALQELLAEDLSGIEAALGLCLDAVAGQDAGGGGAVHAGSGAQAGIGRGGARIEIAAVPFPWPAFAGLIALIVCIVLAVRGYLFLERRRRRQARRHACDLAAQAVPDGGVAVDVRVTDISRLGCRLTPAAALGRPGARIALQVAGLELPARITWQNRHFCGVDFAAPIPQSEIDQILAVRPETEVMDGMVHV